MNLSQSDYQSIRRWMYRNARPLDLARWQYHFEGESQEAVLAALSAYQNEDGGFGNAIEADSWNPDSSPYSTSVAIHILEEIKFRDRDHEIIRNILKYLESTPDFNGEYWAAVIGSNQNYPHAPWWADNTYDWGYTPTAHLAGFILFYASENEEIYEKAKRIAETAINKYLFGIMPNGEAYHNVRREAEIQGLTKMLTFMEEAEVGIECNSSEMKRVLNEQAQTFIEKDDSKWSQYCWKPSVFVKSPDSLFYPGNEKAIETELDYILNQRNAEGVWDINWTWGAYEKEFSISQNWWKANIIIEHLRLLRNFGRL
ncbi:MAG TPA: hypothetical protein VKP08_19290 [Anaerolineales bacterium]|nr:hypothetical protein [Anaerolineales bacterium]